MEEIPWKFSRRTVMVSACRNQFTNLHVKVVVLLRRSHAKIISAYNFRKRLRYPHVKILIFVDILCRLTTQPHGKSIL